MVQPKEPAHQPQQVGHAQARHRFVVRALKPGGITGTFCPSETDTYHSNSWLIEEQREIYIYQDLELSKRCASFLYEIYVQNCFRGKE